jgi:hypothetical protein
LPLAKHRANLGFGLACAPFMLSRIVGGMSLLALVSPLVALSSARAGSPAAPSDVSFADPEDLAPVRGMTAWLSAGVGASTIGGDSGPGERLAFTLGFGPQIFSLRYAYTQESQNCSPCYLVSPLDTNKELGLEYGVKVLGPAVLATASVGAAAIWTTRRGDTTIGAVGQYNSIQHFTVGGTWELGAYLSSRFASFGPAVVLNLNAYQSSAAILVDLHFGYMGKSD